MAATAEVRPPRTTRYRLDPPGPVIWGASRLLGRGLFSFFGGLRFSGTEHLPAEGAALLIGNHRSWADPPAVLLSSARPPLFMANEFLFRIPLLGGIIRFYGSFPVHRGRLDREAIRMAEERLQRGHLLTIFPEGGTTITGVLYPFEGGAAMIAVRQNVPVIPFGITGSDRVLPMKRPFYPRYARGGVHVKFGPAIHPRDLDGALPHRERIRVLTERMEESVAALLPADHLPDRLRHLARPSR